MGYERIPNIVATGTYIPPKPKKQYRITKSGSFNHVQIVTLVDDYDPAQDSMEDCIETIISDDWYYKTKVSDIEEL
jgi:hypothetical protein